MNCISRIKKIVCALFIVFFLSLNNFSFCSSCSSDSWLYVDYLYSMTRICPDYFNTLYDRGDLCNELIKDPLIANAEIIDFFGDIFKKNNLSVEKQRNNKQIPKIIHQIWLGSKLPRAYKEFADKLIELHSDWEYRLWTDDDIEDFDLHNKKIFDKGRNYAYKSNVLRYEILYRYGGVYLDCDCEGLKPFDVLHENYEFYCCLEPFLKNTIIGNAVIASIPGHPILKNAIEDLEENVEFWEKTHLDRCNNNLAKSGTSYFTSRVLKTLCMQDSADICENVIILPTTYFYPKIYRSDTPVKDIEKYKMTNPESFALHYWDLGWLRKRR